MKRIWRPWRLSGIDKESGLKRHQVVYAWDLDSALSAAALLGLLVDEFEQLPIERHSSHETVFAVAKLLTLFAALGVLVFGLNITNSAIQECVVLTAVCGVLIFARIMQAEEHSRKEAP